MSAEAIPPSSPEDPHAVDIELLHALRELPQPSHSPEQIIPAPYTFETPRSMVRTFERNAAKEGISDLRRDHKIELSSTVKLAHHTVSDVFERKKNQTEKTGVITSWQAVRYESVNKAIETFFQDFPSRQWSDRAIHRQRDDWLKSHVQIAQSMSGRFPEVGEAIQLLLGCNQEQLHKITPAITILVACYGRRFEQVGRGAGASAIPIGSGPTKIRNIGLTEDDIL